jgi:uncharacterized membrane protein YadS
MRNWIRTEDSWAVATGLFVIVLGLPNPWGINLLGWVVSVSEWLDPARALAPAAKGWTELPGWSSLLLTYLFLLVILSVGAWALRSNMKRFVVGFSALFWISYLCWFLGHNAFLATTPDKRAAFGISWSLGLTGEAGYLVALAVGLLIGNLFPSRAAWWRDSARTEWFIKTAIVIMGARLGLQAAEAAGLARVILFRGLAAIVEAYLVYWALVYLVARKLFGYSREWAAPLASGISICGVSAAITTGAAIRARPVVPIMVSSLVVIFAVIEMIFLPAIARTFMADEPMVAAAWMGLAVKTDGAAISSGAITESLIYAKAAEAGVSYKTGWMLLTTTTVKVFIDLFIGVWAIVLSVVWVYGIEKKPGQRLPIAEIWQRFPKFVFGYVITFVALLAIGLAVTDKSYLAQLRTGINETDQFRRIFFVMTFLSIGLGANLRRLWAEGLGRLALVYVVCLFGFVIWIGLVISWLFFHGVLPPPASLGAS